VVICLEQGADLHMAQLMPLPLTVSCFSKIQVRFTFLVPAHPGSPGKRAVKRVCVCVRVCVCIAVWPSTAYRGRWVTYCIDRHPSVCLSIRLSAAYVCCNSRLLTIISSRTRLLVGVVRGTVDAVIRISGSVCLSISQRCQNSNQ